MALNIAPNDAKTLWLTKKNVAKLRSVALKAKHQKIRKENLPKAQKIKLHYQIVELQN